MTAETAEEAARRVLSDAVEKVFGNVREDRITCGDVDEVQYNFARHGTQATVFYSQKNEIALLSLYAFTQNETLQETIDELVTLKKSIDLLTSRGYETGKGQLSNESQAVDCKHYDLEISVGGNGDLERLLETIKEIGEID